MDSPAARWCVTTVQSGSVCRQVHDHDREGHEVTYCGHVVT